MIVLNVTYQCRHGMRDRFLEQITAEGIDAASRGEKGNIRYDYFLPAAEKDELLLVEKWQDADALTGHGHQPHYARLKEIKAEYVTETIIERFDTGE